MVLDRVNSPFRSGTAASNAGVTYHGKRIQAGLSTQIIIQVADDAPNGTHVYTIGAVQSLTVNESREIAEVHEVGTDGIITLVPKSATTYSLDIDRLVFDFQRLPQSLQREYRHIHAQRLPFDIVVTDYNPYLATAAGPLAGGSSPSAPGSGTPPSGELTQSTLVRTTFGNCWFTKLSFSYKANDYLITESCNLKCEYVKDDAAPVVLKAPYDQLERNENTSNTASVMSAFDATITP